MPRRKPLCFAACLVWLATSSYGQVIDAESYVKERGHQKREQSGKGVFYTTSLIVSDKEMVPYMRAVQNMPRSEDARKLCSGQSVAVKALFEGSETTRVKDAYGFGGPVDGKFACVFFFESLRHGHVVGSMVYFLKPVPTHSGAYSFYTVVVTH